MGRGREGRTGWEGKEEIKGRKKDGRKKEKNWENGEEHPHLQ